MHVFSYYISNKYVLPLCLSFFCLVLRKQPLIVLIMKVSSIYKLLLEGKQKANQDRRKNGTETTQ